jgi:hypothetical protein
MKKKKSKKFSWCPVCMVHTYHKKEKGIWRCTDWNHEDFLRFRSDPWIEEYRKAKIENRIPAHSEV